MKATKIYGNSIYVNNEKVILSRKAIEVLSYHSDVVYGGFNSKVIATLETIAGSSDDLEVVKAAEKSEIVEIDKNLKGFNFKGFALLSEGKCFYVHCERDGHPMSFKGEKAQAVYNQLIND